MMNNKKGMDDKEVFLVREREYRSGSNNMTMTDTDRWTVKNRQIDNYIIQLFPKSSNLYVPVYQWY